MISKIIGALLFGVLFSSCNNANIPGIATYDFSVKNNQLNADFVATTIQIQAGLTAPIPNLKGATVGMNPYLPTDGSNTKGTIFSFNIDLTQLPDVNYAVAGLPDGRALPDVSGGQLPRWNFEIQNVQIYVYLADGAFSIFVPIDLSSDGVALPDMLSQEIDDERGNLVGKVYAIPQQGGSTQSGLLVLLPFIGSTPSSQALN